MSTAGKVFLIITLIAAMAGGYFAYVIVEQRDKWHKDWVTTDGILKTTKKKLEDTEKTLAETKATLATTQTNLAETKKNLEDTTAKLTDTTAKLEESDKSLADAKAKLTESTAKVEELTKNLDSKTSEAKDTMEKLTTLQGEKRILDDTLQKTNAEVARLNDIIHRSEKGEMPKTINGKITAVNKAWNFVVLNVGLKDGVVENGVFMVYRDRQLLGKVKVVSAEETSCVADIMPEWTKGEIKVGDETLN
jgi:septal ring factor EnvC (AmiA/AmiB activator)